MTKNKVPVAPLIELKIAASISNSSKELTPKTTLSTCLFNKAKHIHKEEIGTLYSQHMLFNFVKLSFKESNFSK